MEIYDYIIIFTKMFVLISFLIFIVRGIVREKHIRTKGIVQLIISTLLLIIGIVALIIDYQIGKLYDDNIFYYIFFSASALIYAIFGIVLLLKSKNFAAPLKKEIVYTLHQKIEYIYLLYKYNNKFYVQKETNTGIIYKMKKTEFSDDVVNKLNNKYLSENGIRNSDISDDISDDIIDIDKIGTITREENKLDHVYYCYLISLQNELVSDEFVELDNLKVSELDIPSLDKYIIIKCLMGSKFDDKY